MAKLAIIKDADKLCAEIEKTRKAYESVGTKVHRDVVSAVYVAATTGNTVPINKIYGLLRSNDQQAVKLWVRRIQIINGISPDFNPDDAPMHSDFIQAALADGSVLTLKKNEFTIVQGPNTQAATDMANLLVNRMINPDGKRDFRVLSRNNFAETKTLGDTDVLSALMKAAKAESSDKKEYHISDPVSKLLEEVYTRAETMKNQIELSTAH